MIFSGVTSSPSSMVSRPAVSENIQITWSPWPRPSTRVAVIINGGMSHNPETPVFTFHSCKSPAAFSSPDLEGNPIDCHVFDSPSSFSHPAILSTSSFPTIRLSSFLNRFSTRILIENGSLFISAIPYPLTPAMFQSSDYPKGLLNNAHNEFYPQYLSKIHRATA